jgi:hypothetical protein
MSDVGIVYHLASFMKFNLEFLDEETKLSDVLSVRLEVGGSFPERNSFASFSGWYFNDIILDSFSATYPEFTKHFILQSNVRISLVHIWSLNRFEMEVTRLIIAIKNYQDLE